MPSDYQPPPFSMVRQNTGPSFEALCLRLSFIDGYKRVYYRCRLFSTDEYTVNYSSAEVHYVVAKLKMNNLYVDYGTEMDDKSVKDYIVIKEAPVELKAEAKKL